MSSSTDVERAASSGPFLTLNHFLRCVVFHACAARSQVTATDVGVSHHSAPGASRRDGLEPGAPAAGADAAWAPAQRRGCAASPSSRSTHRVWRVLCSTATQVKSLPVLTIIIFCRPACCGTVQVAQRLMDEPLSAVYSSDLARAVQSAAEIAAATGLQVA